MRRGLDNTYQSLGIRNYRLFATGQLIKLLGVWMQFIAQDWLVFELSHNSASALGVVAGPSGGTGLIRATDQVTITVELSAGKGSDLAVEWFVDSM